MLHQIVANFQCQGKVICCKNARNIELVNAALAKLSL
jgi:hypothetical protein